MIVLYKTALQNSKTEMYLYEIIKKKTEVIDQKHHHELTCMCRSVVSCHVEHWIKHTLK